MKRNFFASLVSLFLFAPIGSSAHAEKILVSAAASLTDALNEIARTYGAKSKNTVRFNFGPSNGLARQIEEGAPADISVLAPDLQVTVSAQRMRSKSRNTPFDGWTLRGGVAATIVGGRVVYRNEQISLLM